MCCLIALGAFIPRVVLALVWILTDWVSQAINGWFWAFLGLLFLPFTTLAYVLCYHYGRGVHGFEWFIVGLCFVIDIGELFGGGRGARERYAT
jgi:uncharacterized membrane protein